MRRVLAALAGVTAAAAAAATLAQAFFFEATDQPLGFRAATPDQYVLLHSTTSEPFAPFRPLYARQRAGIAVDLATFAATGGGAAPLALDLGASRYWNGVQRAIDRAFTLEATSQLPGDAPVAVTLETEGPLKAELRSPVAGRRIGQLAEPQPYDEVHRGRVDLDVTSPNANGDYRATITVRLAFADGSRMRYVVPVVWRDL